MHLFSAKGIKEFLGGLGMGPSKRFGQNFLIDQNILDKIVAAGDIAPEDTVVEVGPGLGTLTRALSQKAGKVIAIEKDRNMVQVLKKELPQYGNIALIEQDILHANIGALAGGPYKVVANIPYYLTSPLIRQLLEAELRPTEIVLMVQKEVAQRITAAPPDMNLLAVSVQYYADPKILFTVSKNSFWPVPKIDSAIIKITPRPVRPQNPTQFFAVVKAGFSHPRKQLAGNLSNALSIKKESIEQWLLKTNIHPTRRAQTLSLQEWQALVTSHPQ